MDDSAEIQRLLRIVERGTHQEQIAARVRLGTLYAERGQWDSAAECIEQVLSAGYRFPLALRILAAIRVQQGCEEEARALFDEAQQLAEREGTEAGQEQAGRIRCSQCGHWSAPARNTCKNCRSPLARAHGGELAAEVAGLWPYRHIILFGALVLLVTWLWPHLSWGSILVALVAWFVFGLVLRALGVYPR